MVKTGDSLPLPGHSAVNLPNLNCMNKLPNFSLQQCLNPDPYICSSQTEFHESFIPHAALNLYPKNGMFHSFSSYFETMRPNVLPYLVDKHCDSSLRLARMTLPGSNTEFSKREFIIFDQSGHQTSVMHSSGCCAQIPVSISEKYCSHGLNDDDEEEAAGDIGLENYLFHNGPSKNEIAGEESEMHEDTEEINALLYSDDDSHYSSDDEVTSTGHSPPLIKELYDKQIEEMNEEVASSAGPRKRQRLLDGGDGGHKKSSDAPVSVKVDAFRSYGVDTTKSSYTGGGSQGGHQMESGSGNFSSKKDKLQETLKLLESMVPGVKGKHPLLVIDEAIDYLKSLKFKAKAMGLDAMLPH